MGNAFDGVTIWLLPHILISAFAGLTTAVVLKVLNVILKCFASIFAIILTTFLSWLLFGYQPPSEFWIAMGIFVCAIYLYCGPHNSPEVTQERGGEAVHSSRGSVHDEGGVGDTGGVSAGTILAGGHGDDGCEVVPIATKKSK